MSMMPGVLARPLQHAACLRVGSFFKMQARAFVGAMLAPHHAEDAEFRVGRLAAQQGTILSYSAAVKLMRGDDSVVIT